MGAIQNWFFHRCKKFGQTNLNSTSGSDMGNSRPINTAAIYSFLSPSQGAPPLLALS